MEVKYEQDANGNYILDENGERKPISLGMVFDGINTYEIYATTPRQAEQLREVINSSTKMMDYDQSIIDIVKEEAAAYFAGQKSRRRCGKTRPEQGQYLYQRAALKRGVSPLPAHQSFSPPPFSAGG